jgi:hypothetical protein
LPPERTKVIVQKHIFSILGFQFYLLSYESAQYNFLKHTHFPSLLRKRQ